MTADLTNATKQTLMHENIVGTNQPLSPFTRLDSLVFPGGTEGIWNYTIEDVVKEAIPGLQPDYGYLGGVLSNIALAQGIHGELILPGSLPMNAFYDFKISEDSLPNSIVTTNKIQDTAVTANKIQNAAVTTNKIQDTAVTSKKIQDAAVTTTKIQDDAVTTNKIQDNAVITNKIRNGAVTKEKLDEVNKNYLLTVGDILDTTIGVVASMRTDEKLMTARTNLQILINDFKT